VCVVRGSFNGAAAPPVFWSPAVRLRLYEYTMVHSYVLGRQFGIFLIALHSFTDPQGLVGCGAVGIKLIN